MKQYTPVSELISLSKKRAIVTGGAVGIGFAIAYRLAEAGATVVIADSNRDKGQEASEELKSYGYDASFIQCDVSQEQAVQGMVFIDK